MKRIEITIDILGKTTVETKGFAGTECIQASKFIESALEKAERSHKTAAYFNANSLNSSQLSEKTGH